MKVHFISLRTRLFALLTTVSILDLTEGSPYSLRPSSSISPGQLSSHQSVISGVGSPSFVERPQSIHSVERRPLGPRSPSPLPLTSPRPQSYSELPAMDDDIDDPTSSQRPSSSTSHYNPQTPGIKRSARQHLFPVGNTDATPKSNMLSSIPIATPIEPLSIKKKTSLRNSGIPTNPSTMKKMYARSSPLNKTLHRVVSPRRVSPQIRRHKLGNSVSSSKDTDFEELEHLVVSAKEDVSFPN